MPERPAEGTTPVSKLTLLVESAPPGAIIVVDGRPVGKAPVRITVPATPLGFFRDYVEIRARFVAADATEVTHTTLEEFTPREKVPAVLRFTPEGAQRTGH
ncbi:MAG: PEGA domain-containing protein [Opitutaceae bacterium]|nr:PEGA domain-containing protein [Opitutaceae bacterium]